MKKLLLLALAFLSIQLSQAQDPVDQFIARYAHARAGEKVVLRLDRPVLALALPFIPREHRHWLHKTRRIELMALENVNRADISEGFRRLSGRLQERNYEPLITVREEKNHITILGRTDRNDNIRDLVLLVNDHDEHDAVLIRLSGLFRMSDLEKIQEGVANNRIR